MFSFHVLLWLLQGDFGNNKVPYCVKFYPVDDNIFLMGCSNKKIIQYDIREGKEVQNYDHHLAPVNSIMFVEEGRRMVRINPLAIYFFVCASCCSGSALVSCTLISVSPLSHVCLFRSQPATTKRCWSGITASLYRLSISVSPECTRCRVLRCIRINNIGLVRQWTTSCQFGMPADGLAESTRKTSEVRYLLAMQCSHHFPPTASFCFAAMAKGNFGSGITAPQRSTASCGRTRKVQQSTHSGTHTIQAGSLAAVGTV